ncbi:MAG: hypothetical protein QM708_13465 [Propioniciclava sp.]|uniref:hypothetical protein n=1 Tax=Propioniciclava sp. TaxID=2038686 RepID=UPI0039E35BFF
MPTPRTARQVLPHARRLLHEASRFTIVLDAVIVATSLPFAPPQAVLLSAAGVLMVGLSGEQKQVVAGLRRARPPPLSDHDKRDYPSVTSVI